MLVDQCARVVAGDAEQRYPLIIARLLARVLTVPDDEHLGDWIVVLPADAGDFLLPQGRRNGEANDASDRYDLPGILFERRNDPVDLAVISAITNIAHSVETHPEIAGQPILLTSPTSRRHLFKLTSRFIPQLVVLSHNELTSEANIQSVATVELSNAG